jgi:hypothetical protein
MITTPPVFGATLDVTPDDAGTQTSLDGVADDSEELGTAVMMIPGGSFVGVPDLRPRPTLTIVGFRLTAGAVPDSSSSELFSSSV